jgi:hypothetical protein
VAQRNPRLRRTAGHAVPAARDARRLMERLPAAARARGAGGGNARHGRRRGLRAGGEHVRRRALLTSAFSFFY